MHAIPTAPPPLTMLPFCLTLAGIAMLPLFAPHFWDRNRNKALFCSMLSAPVVWWLLKTQPGELVNSLKEYASFIALLGSLFVVAGGIHVAGNLAATPRTNTLILGIAAFLANIVGTTGASVLLIRLILSTNVERRNTRHIPFFFILVVANCGGLLTPLGDPPLFLGYLRGVPFFWTLRLWPIWLLAVGYLLGVFYFFDRRAYAAERTSDRARDLRETEPIRILGKRNLLFLAVTVGAVFMASPWRESVMLCSAIAAFFLGSARARRSNEFAFTPIVEVAVLFAGIFITMVPALQLLHVEGKELGLTTAWQYFLATGLLSSVLDNAPTYLAFLSAAQGLELPAQIVGVPTAHLVAISSGAVLMGANTYIGNGPNFMVKAIADHAGYRTHSFVGYAARAMLVLAPVYAVIVAYLGICAAR